jgi:hypothetical protein
LVDRAVDLTTPSAALVHDNERRWRVFRERAEAGPNGHQRRIGLLFVVRTGGSRQRAFVGGGSLTSVS